MLVTIFLEARLELTSFSVALATIRFTPIVLIRLLRVAWALTRCMSKARTAFPSGLVLELKLPLVMLVMTYLTVQTSPRLPTLRAVMVTIPSLAVLVMTRLEARLVPISFAVVWAMIRFTPIVRIRLSRAAQVPTRCMSRVRTASPSVLELELKPPLVMLATTRLTDLTSPRLQTLLAVRAMTP